MSFQASSVFLVAGAILFLALVYFAVGVFNNYVVLKHLARKASANIEVLLKQRFDELPKLVDAVKGYSRHEADVLSRIVSERSKVMALGSGERIQESDRISKALSHVFLVAENYPELKANRSFIDLQERISSIESEISQRREFYNETAAKYNAFIESFPNSLLAKAMNLREMELFQEKPAGDFSVKL